jgi:GH25 family lysozyme M1 (1,4-beta-N-acetylmuramidase)/LysM repeat protein
MKTRNSSNLKGIDISHDKGNIDFARVKGAGIQAVYIKVSEGHTFLDPLCSKNMANAKANGLNFGGFHWLTANTDDSTIVLQANWFYDHIKDSGFNLVPVLDVEEDPLKSLGKQMVTHIVHVFMDEFKRLSNIDCMLYASTNFIENYFDSSLTGYLLWVAHYGVSAPGENGIFNIYDGWQYSSIGAIDGISGNVDMDTFCDSIIIKPIEVAKPAPQPTPVTAVGGFSVGQTVTVKTTASTYATGQNIASFVKGSKYTVVQLKSDRALLSGIMSWVWLSDLQIGSVAAPQPAPQVIYTVVKGDILSRIASKYGKTVAELVKLNGIPNPDRIFVGQKIRIS